MQSTMLAVQATYQAGCGNGLVVSTAPKTARAEACEFARAARNVLENYLGTKHSEAWRPTGFILNLSLPQGAHRPRCEGAGDASSPHGSDQ